LENSASAGGQGKKKGSAILADKFKGIVLIPEKGKKNAPAGWQKKRKKEESSEQGSG